MDYQGEEFILPAVGEGYKVADYYIKIRPDRIYIYDRFDKPSAFPIINLTKEQLRLLWNKINEY